MQLSCTCQCVAWRADPLIITSITFDINMCMLVYGVRQQRSRLCYNNCLSLFSLRGGDIRSNMSVELFYWLHK